MRQASSFIVGIFVVAVLAGGLVFMSSAGCSAPPEAKGLNALPFPGTPDASPQAQIIFPALTPSDVKTVTVQGSSSGRHSGRMSALPDGRGTAFAPDSPFVAGERVTVRAVLTSAEAGTATGAPGAMQIAFGFTVARAPVASTTTTSQATATNSQPVQPPATQSFHSRPDLQPPVVKVSKSEASPDSGYVFVDAQLAPQNGPMIMDAQGDLVWFQPSPADTMALNTRVQTYQGKPVLTWWRGQVLASGHGLGEGVIVDGSYQTVATVHAGEGYEADAHEFLITTRGTALITVYEPVQADLGSVGGPRNGAVFDCIVQEVDIQTGAVLWEWHALGHVPLSASYADKPTDGGPYDFFHVNSIAEAADGDLIVSARNTWAVYKIDRGTGAIIWQLGGKGNSFTMGPDTQFEWQHDVRLQADGSLTLFDNASSPKEEIQSRAMRLQLDTGAMAATLLSSYTHAPPLLAGSQGDVQLLPDGNVFVGWGDQGYFSEFTASGTLIFDASFPPPVQSYRAFRYAWVGRPTAPPSISVETTAAGGRTVYVSWNGATEVARWELLAGPTASDLSPVATVPATGFETAIATATSLRNLAVRALDSSGHVLGTSAAVGP
jgi:hypothetical protein